MTEKNKYTFPQSKSISPPIITIIVATLNSSPTLQRCIESIISQTYPHKELIIIDGGSTDGSLPILEKFHNVISFWESAPDSGVYHAWNKALDHSHGEWVCFLGADDFFRDDNVLTSFVPYLTKAIEKGIKVVYGQVVKVDKEGRTLNIQGQPWPKIGWLMKHGMPIPHPGMMHHRSLFEIHGKFDQSFRVAGDYDFLLRELKDNQALFAKNIKSVMHQTGGLADSNGVLAHLEVAHARRKNGLHTFSLIWMLVHIKTIFQYYFFKLTKKFTDN